MLDNARNRIQQTRETRGIPDAAEMGVDNSVAAIGDKNVAIPRLADRHFAGTAGLSESLGKGVPGRRHAERDHFHRQRIPALKSGLLRL